MKIGDKVKVMYGICDPKGKQGEVGKVFKIKEVDENTTRVTIVFEDEIMGVYEKECLSVEKSCFWKVGHFYKSRNGRFVKVEEFSSWGEILGKRFCHYEGFVKLNEYASLNSFFENGQEIEEISETEFYQELHNAQDYFYKTFETIADKTYK